MDKYIKENEITYELRGEQYYPLLELPEQKEIGKYGRLHLEYLKEYRKGRRQFCLRPICFIGMFYYKIPIIARIF